MSRSRNKILSNFEAHSYYLKMKKTLITIHNKNFNFFNSKLILIATICTIIGSCGEKPSSDFSYSPSNPKAGEMVQFENLSLNSKKFDWNLGNMKISSEKNPSNVYEKAGEYIVDCTARNGMKSDTKTMTIVVE